MSKNTCKLKSRARWKVKGEMLMHDAEFHRADGEIAGMGGARAVIERLLEVQMLDGGGNAALLVPRGDDNRE
jgi:hypothetical protein